MYIIKIIDILVLSWLILLSFYHQIKTEILYKEDQVRLKRSRIIFGQLIVMDIIFSGCIYYLVISLWECKITNTHQKYHQVKSSNINSPGKESYHLPWVTPTNSSQSDTLQVKSPILVNQTYSCYKLIFR